MKRSNTDVATGSAKKARKTKTSAAGATVIHDSDDNELGKVKELKKRNKLTFEDQESIIDEVYDSERILSLLR